MAGVNPSIHLLYEGRCLYQSRCLEKPMGCWSVSGLEVPAEWSYPLLPHICCNLSNSRDFKGNVKPEVKKMLLSAAQKLLLFCASVSSALSPCPLWLPHQWKGPLLQLGFIKVTVLLNYFSSYCNSHQILNHILPRLALKILLEFSEYTCTDIYVFCFSWWHDLFYISFLFFIISLFCNLAGNSMKQAKSKEEKSISYKMWNNT